MREFRFLQKEMGYLLRNIVCINSSYSRYYANNITDNMRSLEHIRYLISRGIWSFTFEDAYREWGVNPKNELSFLRKEGRIVSPARGFYVIMPEETSLLGRLPVERYVHELMEHFGVPYYAGLLTAAEFHGSAHQSPQVFQVITSPARRTIKVKQTKIVFYRKKYVEKTPIVLRKTATGYFNVSTPEATFFDIIVYSRKLGGLDHVALITLELADRFTANGLGETARKYSIPIVQRGGYLLECLGFEQGAKVLESWLDSRNPRYSYLNPSGEKYREPKHERWKLIINDKVDIPA